MRKRILFITPNAIHGKTGNAGAKTVYYYFNRFKNDERFEAALAYTGNVNADYELMITDLKGTGIFTGYEDKSPVKKVVDYLKFNFLYDILKKYVPIYYATNGFIGKRVKTCINNVKVAGFIPEIIVVEFTILILWVDVIKAVFPNSLLIASCHDITFLSVERFLANADFSSGRAISYYQRFKTHEISCLNKYDLLVYLNQKDKRLLEKQSEFGKVPSITISAYFDSYNINISSPKDSIVFFGSMSRIENYQAVEWFLNQVWVKLNTVFNGEVKFIIVGGGLPKDKKIIFEKFSNVSLTGFLVDPSQVFSRSFCFVAPLSLGAGIKVKVLEAMNAGIPVVTNDIGIEGIPAHPNVDYLHCNTPDEYMESIVKLQKNNELQKTLGVNSKNLIKSNFNVDESYANYSTTVLSSLDSFDHS